MTAIRWAYEVHYRSNAFMHIAGVGTRELAEHLAEAMDGMNGISEVEVIEIEDETQLATAAQARRRSQRDIGLRAVRPGCGKDHAPEALLPHEPNKYSRLNSSGKQ